MIMPGSQRIVFYNFKCPTCGTNLQTVEVLRYCPVKGCNVFIGDKMAKFEELDKAKNELKKT